MGRIDDLRSEFGNEIAEVVNDLTVMTPLTSLQLKSISDDEKKDMRALLNEVRAATNENEQNAILAANVGKALKLVMKVAGIAI